MGKAAQTFILICFLSLFFAMPAWAADKYNFTISSSDGVFVYNPGDGANYGTSEPSRGYYFSNYQSAFHGPISKDYKSIFLTDVSIVSTPSSSYDYSDISLCVIVNNTLYEYYPSGVSASGSGKNFYFDDIRLPIFMDNENGDLNMTYYIRGYLSNSHFQDVGSPAISTSYVLTLTYQLSTEAYGGDSTDQLLQDQLDQDKAFHDQDKDDATTAGNDVAGAATDLDNLKSKWEILWYPIEFTNNIMAAFSGSDNTRYRSRYAGVVGYSYDDTSGFLVPVYAASTLADGDIPASPGGTVITFPSYTLPVLNVKLWDSYSYDLSQITEQYPVLFNAIYVIITILEVYWFVGFLRDKYEEVFGK